MSTPTNAPPRRSTSSIPRQESGIRRRGTADSKLEAGVYEVDPQPNVIPVGAASFSQVDRLKSNLVSIIRKILASAVACFVQSSNTLASAANSFVLLLASAANHFFLRLVSAANDFVLRLASAVNHFVLRLFKPHVGVIASLFAIWRYATACVISSIIFAVALHFQLPDLAIFLMGGVAIVSLAMFLEFATYDISRRVGYGIFNTPLGNLVELTIAIHALKKCELAIVQSSLIGSILNNLLLVLGLCIVIGGSKFHQQGFAVGAAQVNSSLLFLPAGAMLHITVYYWMSQNTDGSDAEATAATQARILKFSRGIAIVMLFVYVCYQLFQFVSHAQLYQDDSADIAKSTVYQSRSRNSATPVGSVPDGIPHVEEPQSVNHEHPQINGWVCVVLLIGIIVAVVFVAGFVVASINGLTASGKISKQFVGLVLLPIFGNTSRFSSAVRASVKDKLTLTMRVAFGSSIQIFLFVIPLITMVGWGSHKPMSLFFDPFEVICLFLVVITANQAVQGSHTTWANGFILMGVFGMLAMVFFYYPGTPQLNRFAACT